ncbi:hypothetical protein Anapl_01982 [Anas platyrhynchos]|uniref:Uncharacterized protein n=1 Tax=Anas platyrhynchos TaxID=8839 RepID=R0M4G5_ANAPL|nr:hypothetical protein Anapl_01982 [Anas platyrhynchos]
MTHRQELWNSCGFPKQLRCPQRTPANEALHSCGCLTCSLSRQLQAACTHTHLALGSVTHLLVPWAGPRTGTDLCTQLALITPCHTSHSCMTCTRCAHTHLLYDSSFGFGHSSFLSLAIKKQFLAAQGHCNSNPKSFVVKSTGSKVTDILLYGSKILETLLYFADAQITDVFENLPIQNLYSSSEKATESIMDRCDMIPGEAGTNTRWQHEPQLCALKRQYACPGEHFTSPSDLQKKPQVIHIQTAIFTRSKRMPLMERAVILYHKGFRVLTVTYETSIVMKMYQEWKNSCTIWNCKKTKYEFKNFKHFQPRATYQCSAVQKPKARSYDY